ncbi:hypothetical protein ACFV0D_22115, partial [Streptomyces sp. NPDC059556]
MATPGTRHWPDGADFLDAALSAVVDEERAGYIERLEAFVEEHRDRLEELLRAYGPGSRPASHGRYALVGQGVQDLCRIVRDRPKVYFCAADLTRRLVRIGAFAHASRGTDAKYHAQHG